MVGFQVQPIARCETAAVNNGIAWASQCNGCIGRARAGDVKGAAVHARCKLNRVAGLGVGQRLLQGTSAVHGDGVEVHVKKA